MVDRIERKYLSHEVAERLRNMILHEDYRAGDRLPPMSDLAEELGVGQSSVREGLRQLEAAGFVRIKHGRGVFVAESAFDPIRITAASTEIYRYEDLAFLWQTRQFLERGNAGASVDCLNREGERQLTECLYKLKANLQLPDVFMKWETEFHLRIAIIAVYKYTTQILEAIWGLTRPYESEAYRSEDSRERGYGYHKRIRDAIVAGDAEEAGRLMNEHLAALGDTILVAKRA